MQQDPKLKLYARILIWTSSLCMCNTPPAGSDPFYVDDPFKYWLYVTVVSVSRLSGKKIQSATKNKFTGLGSNPSSFLALALHWPHSTLSWSQDFIWREDCDHTGKCEYPFRESNVSKNKPGSQQPRTVSKLNSWLHLQTFLSGRTWGLKRRLTFTQSGPAQIWLRFHWAY